MQSWLFLLAVLNFLEQGSKKERKEGGKKGERNEASISEKPICDNSENGLGQQAYDRDLELDHPPTSDALETPSLVVSEEHTAPGARWWSNC